MVTGGAIDLDEVTQPKVLDPRGVEREHSGSSAVPYMFPIEARDSAAVNPDAIRSEGQAPPPVARPLRVLWRIVLRRGSAEIERKRGCCVVAAVWG